MNRKTTIALFYTGVAIISIAIIGTGFYLRSRLPKPKMPLAINLGKEEVKSLFKISEDLTAVNQDGQTVHLSDLKGKVWLVAEFFAICPHCALRNGAELHEISEVFKNNPDFHIVCISVDPANDNAEKLRDYASALNADSKRWWFLNAGDVAATHAYLERELKFMGIRERTNPLEVESMGRYEHDLGFLLIDRNFQVVGKWPLPDARSEEARKDDPGLYDRLKSELYARIRKELDQPKPSPAP